MKRERWQRVKNLYNSVLELEPDRRDAYLREACAGDEEMRAEIERLLACQPDAERFIESPALHVAGCALAAGNAKSDRTGKDGESGEQSGRRDHAPANRRFPPWWMYVVLVPCTLLILVFWYLLFAGPETLGFVSSSGNVLLVQPGLAADRAGLQVGDVILSVNGRTGPAGMREFRTLYVGRTFRMIVRSQGKEKAVDLTAGRKGWNFWTDPEGLAYLADVPAALVCLFMAWLIAFRRPGNAAARLGALMLSMVPVGIAFFYRARVPGFDTFLARMPVVLAVIPYFAISLNVAAFNPVTLTFFGTFPRGRVRRRWLRAAVWLPPLVTGIAHAYAQYLLVFRSMRLPPLLIRMQYPVRVVLLGYTILIFLAIVRNYRRLEGASARRRNRVILAGGLLILAPKIPDILFRLTIPLSPGFLDVLFAYLQSPLYVLNAFFGAAGPLLIAYAILRHRIFDLRVMIRQGLQYAAARHVLLALAPMFGILLAADLALHSNRTMAQAFLQRGWLYAALGAAAVATHVKRTAWLTALDRRFFRERYDARRILQDLLGQVRRASGLEEAAAHVVSRVDMALHPEFAALLMRRPAQDRFHVLTSSGAIATPPEIRSESKLMGLVRLLGKPVEVQLSEKDWLRRRLPEDESLWLTEARIEWLFPISLGGAAAEIILALGPKRSEEPYSREDQDLIEGIASGLALLSDRFASGAEAPRAGLEEKDLPRLPARYSILGELGRGGMGAVYEAEDTDLQRGVAIKVMRRELMSSEAAVVRFKREARAAAGFSHPNVVTVYDFGLGQDGGAFLVMELLAGSTLRALLRKERRLDAARAVDILRGVCSAVEAAHARRLVHRDLKPENIFIAAANGMEIPKILDFGVARALESTAATISAGGTAPGQLLGTLAYMSPEQLRGGLPEPGWDLWALGVVSYEMLTGAHPFTSPDMPVNTAVLAGRMTTVEKHLGPQGKPWEEFFKRCLATDGRMRPDSAREFFKHFETAALALEPRAQSREDREEGNAGD